jgi:hypothetical protein
VVSIAVLDNASGRQFYDKENVEPLKAEQINSEEIAGKQGVPVGFEECFPGFTVGSLHFI